MRPTNSDLASGRSLVIQDTKMAKAASSLKTFTAHLGKNTCKHQCFSSLVWRHFNNSILACINFHLRLNECTFYILILKIIFAKIICFISANNLILERMKGELLPAGQQKPSVFSRLLHMTTRWRQEHVHSKASLEMVTTSAICVAKCTFKNLNFHITIRYTLGHRQVDVEGFAMSLLYLC